MKINQSVLNQYKIIPDKNSITSKQIDDSVYFGEEYKNYISNSKLSLLEDGDLIKYLYGLKPKTTSSLQLGTAVHALILQGNEYEISNQTKPSEKSGLMVDSIFKYRSKGMRIIDSILEASNEVNYYKGKLSNIRIKSLIQNGLDYYLYLLKDKFKTHNKNQIILDTRSKLTAETCISSILRNNHACNLLYPKGENIISKYEDTLLLNTTVEFPNSLIDELADDAKIKLALKIKIDHWYIDFDEKIIVMNDLKTTGRKLYMFPGSICNETQEFLLGSFQHYHYYRQMSFYIWILCLYLQKEYNINLSEYKIFVNMIVVSTVPEYLSGIYRVTNKWIYKGFEEFSHLLKLAAYAEYNRDELLASESLNSSLLHTGMMDFNDL